MLPTDLDIFSLSSRTIPLCIHSRASGAPRAARGLGRLVLVVGEDQVRAAAVDLEVDARAAPPPSPSTRCASPAGRAPRASPRPCPRRASAPSRGRSRAGRACARRPRCPRPGPSGRRSGGIARRRPGRSAPRSRRRRRPRRHVRARSTARSARRSPRSSRWPAARGRAGRGRGVGVGDVGVGHLRGQLGAARPAGSAAA